MKLISKMAWRNLSRNPRRTVITISGLAMALAMAISTWVLFDGFTQLSVDALVASEGHVRVEHPGQLEQKNFYDVIPDSDALMAELEKHPKVKSVEPQITAAALVSGEAEAAGAQVIAIDVQRDTSRRSKQVAEGTWLAGPKSVVLGTGLATRIEVGVGDDVTIMSQATDGSLANASWTVVGLVETGSPDIDRSTMWVGMDEAREVFVLDGFHGLAVRLHDSAHSRDMVKELDQRELFTGVPADLGAEDIPEDVNPFRTPMDPDAAVVARSWKSVNPMMGEYSELSRIWSAVTIFIVLATAAMGAMNTMLMSVLERTRELGVLMATGLRPPHVVALIVLENVALGVVSLVVGTVLGAAAGWYMVEIGFDLSSSGQGDFEFSGISMEPVFRGIWSVEAFIVPAFLMGVVTLGGSVFPALRAAMLKPVDAMRADR
jgi:putative ABC transport system permease protein